MILTNSDPRVAVDPFLEQMQHELDTPVSLGNWTGERRITYSDPSATQGLYMLDLTSTRSDSVVSILATTTAASNPVYPALPAADRRVKVVRVSRSRRFFTFSWPDAGPANAARSVEYCVSVTKVRNFRTHCAFVAHSQGDKAPVLSRDSEWGFTWEREAMRNLRMRANPVKPMSPRKMLLHQCVGSKREFTFPKARRGKTYHVDVYVVDKSTHKAAAYDGAVVTMPGRTGPKPLRQILDGERKLLKLKNDNASSQTVTFEAKQHMTLLSVEFAVCAGKIPVEIYHNRQRVHRSVVRRWKRVRMKNVLPGTYAFRFPRSKRRTSFVSVYLTSRPAALTLPRDMSIKVFHSMTTCSNVTVAWMGTHKKQKYCLYVKEAAHIRSVKRHSCSSMADRPRSERVLCTRYRNADLDKAVMTGTITGLKHNTRYMVDVYLSRGHSGPVAYKSVKVRTKAGC